MTVLKTLHIHVKTRTILMSIILSNAVYGQFEVSCYKSARLLGHFACLLILQDHYELPLFFFEQILFKNLIPAQDGQRPVIQKLQSKGAVYRQTT